MNENKWWRNKILFTKKKIISSVAIIIKFNNGFNTNNVASEYIWLFPKNLKANDSIAYNWEK